MWNVSKFEHTLNFVSNSIHLLDCELSLMESQLWLSGIFVCSKWYRIRTIMSHMYCERAVLCKRGPLTCWLAGIFLKFWCVSLSPISSPMLLDWFPSSFLSVSLGRCGSRWFAAGDFCGRLYVLRFSELCCIIMWKSLLTQRVFSLLGAFQFATQRGRGEESRFPNLRGGIWISYF